MSAAQPVRVEYRDKPPYIYTLDGVPQGFLMDRLQTIFSRAGVPVSFDEVPMKRMFTEIRNNRDRICSAGSYKLKEREEFANFSLIIHQDKPHLVLVAPRVLAGVKQHKSLNALLQDPNIKLGVVANVSYGPQLDKLIEGLGYAATQAASSTLRLAKMVARGHGADVMFIDWEDYAYIDRRGELASLGLQMLDLPDMPPGLSRHLMCSRSVDDETMGRINQAIRELLPELNH